MSDNNIIEMKESQLTRITFDQQLSRQNVEFESNISKLEAQNKAKYDGVIIGAREISNTIFNKINFDQSLEFTDNYEASHITVIDYAVDILEFMDVRNWIIKKNPKILKDTNNIFCSHVKFDAKLTCLGPVYKHLTRDIMLLPRHSSGDNSGLVLMYPSVYLNCALAAEQGILHFKMTSRNKHSAKEINNIQLTSDEWFTVEFIDARKEKDIFNKYTLRDLALFENEKATRA